MPPKAAIALLASLSAASACDASAAKSPSQTADKPIAAPARNSQPSLARAPTLDLGLSVEAAYAAIPHRRTTLDFAASSIPEADQRFLQVAFHVIEEGIRARVAAYQALSKREPLDPKLI